MKYIRVVDQVGNRQDYRSGYVPRIGETIIVEYGVGNQPIKQHFLRVKDVAYHLDDDSDGAAAVLVEEIESLDWPT